MERNTNLDMIRIIAMVFVVIQHTWPKPWESIAILNAIMGVVLLSCNSFFYMLSGELNLVNDFHDIRDYKKFYIKRAISILFPYLMVTFLLAVYNMYTGG